MKSCQWRRQIQREVKISRGGGGDGCGMALECMPSVAIVVPVRNEARHIEGCLRSVLYQDYPQERIQVLVVDGMSEDGSRELVSHFTQEHGNVRLLDNPGHTTPVAMNIGIRKADADVVIVLGAHAYLAPDYVGRCIATLRSSAADAVGGRLVALPGKGIVAESISLAISHPFGVGNSRFRYSDDAGFVDTVPYGAYRREVLERVGLFDEKLVRNQDLELNHRIRAAGGRLFYTPAIRSYYHSRASLPALWNQNLQNGFWNVALLRQSPRGLSLRHLVPLFFVLSLVCSAILSIVSPIGLLVLLGIMLSYALLATVSSFLVARRTRWRHFFVLPWVFLCLHLSYGFGYLGGFVRFGLRLGDGPQRGGFG